MPILDTRGKLAAAQIGFYVPVAALTLLLVIRYALRRDAGWLFLFIFSITRIAGGALILAGQLTPNPVLLSAAYIMDYTGLAPLLFSSLGFIGMAGQHTYSENPRVTSILRAVGLLGLVGLALCIAGGVLGTQPTANQNIASTLRRAGVCVYAGMYVILFGTHIGTWTYRWHLRSYRRNLLWGITVALPILGARIAYAIIAAWSSSDLFGRQLSSNPTLAKLNPVTGDWVLYLVLSLILEFAVAALYLFASTVLARRHHH